MFLCPQYILSFSSSSVRQFSVKFSRKVSIKMPPVLFVRGLDGRTSLLQFSELTSVGELSMADLQERVADKVGLPTRLLRLRCGTKFLDEAAEDALSQSLGALGICESETVVHVSVRGCGLLGGKGGFGAQLRDQGKRSGKNKTTDFGACRDLSGRRLRHVNDEKVLQQWKEAQEHGVNYRPDSTKSGISNWFLPLPTWADGVKKGKKERRKTKLCNEWVRSREENNGAPPPQGAPAWYGCPRGRLCQFAHGLSELRGEGAASIIAADAEHQRGVQRQARDEAQDRYVGSVARAARSDDEVANLVAQGLQAAAKRARREEAHPVSAATAASTSTSASASASTSDNQTPPLPLLTLFGTADMIPSTGEIEGGSDFCTAALGVAVPADSGSWYYETELLTAGLMQLGWARLGFACGVDGSGVGDDDFSWSYDGSRGAIFHGSDDENAAPYGGARGPWAAGDVISCLLTLCNGRMKLAYAVNGESLGEAFDLAVPADAQFFPAFSLEDGETLVLNTGQAPFLYPPAANVQSVRAAVGFFPAPLEGLVRAAAGAGAGTVTGTGTVTGSVTVTGGVSGLGPDSGMESGLGAASDEPPHLAPAAAAAAAPPLIDPSQFHAVELESAEFESVERVEAQLGLAWLKVELQRRGLKSGGTLRERAERLFSVRGLREEQIPAALRPKR